jgi:hypothetical protein
MWVAPPFSLEWWGLHMVRGVWLPNHFGAGGSRPYPYPWAVIDVLWYWGILPRQARTSWDWLRDVVLTARVPIG